MWSTSSSQRVSPHQVRRRGPMLWTVLLVILCLTTVINLYKFSEPVEAGARAPGQGWVEVGSITPAAWPAAARQDAKAGEGPGGVEARPLPLGRDRPIKVIESQEMAASASCEVFDDDGVALTDFPCSLSEAGDEDRDKVRTWDGPCLVSCSADGGAAPSGEERWGRCERAARTCELYQECTHVVLAVGGAPWPGEGVAEAQEGAGSRVGQFARLMHRPQGDGSLTAVKSAASAASVVTNEAGISAKWGGKAKGFTLDVRPRTYYVVSYGGSGSKMLSGWLSERGKVMVDKVFHLHDPNPADTLIVKEAKRGVSAGRAAKGKNFRNYDFPEGTFPSSGVKVRDVDLYRVVFIFKDPVEAMVSRYFYNHCKNLRGADCGGSEKAFPGVVRYAEEDGDRLNLETFYDNYCNPHGPRSGRRNYPIVCINYHKIWDNPVAVVQALGLPMEEADKLPPRTETIRNDETSAATGQPYTLSLRERLRKKHASLSAKIFEAPAVAIV